MPAARCHRESIKYSADYAPCFSAAYFPPVAMLARVASRTISCTKRWIMVLALERGADSVPDEVTAVNHS